MTAFALTRGRFLKGTLEDTFPEDAGWGALALARDVSRLAALEARALVLVDLGLRAIRNVMPGLPTVEAS